MRILSFISIFLIINSCIVKLYAQPNKINFRDRLGDTLVLVDIAEKDQFKKRIEPRKYDISGGPMISSDGYGILLTGTMAFGSDEYGNNNEEKYYNSHVVQLEISERKHPKEYQNLNIVNFFGNIFISNGANAYVYAKTNNLYQVKLSYGQRRLFGGRGEEASPLIQYYYMGGITAGILKPYYVNTVNGPVKYSDSTERLFLDKDAILGRGGFTKGWDEIELNIGLHLKAGMHFDFAKNRKKVSAFDLGISMDYYFSELSTLAIVDKKTTFFNLYLAYQFGKRW